MSRAYLRVDAAMLMLTGVLLTPFMFIGELLACDASGLRVFWRVTRGQYRDYWRQFVTGAKA